MERSDEQRAIAEMVRRFVDERILPAVADRGGDERDPAHADRQGARGAPPDRGRVDSEPMSATADTRAQIERAIANVLEEVPALAPLKLVFTLVPSPIRSSGASR